MGLREEQEAFMCGRLSALASQGMTRQQAAGALGITYNRLVQLAIRHNVAFCRQYKIQASTKRSERTEEMASRFQAGETLQTIGDAFGVSRERVRQILTREKGMDRSDGGIGAKAASKRAYAAKLADADAVSRWGCSREQYKALIDEGRRMRAAGHNRETTPTGAFISQKNNAKTRGIRWELTLWQWWTIWQESGRWGERGRGHSFMMCRRSDTGPYAVDNVFIAPGHFNSSSHKGKKLDLPTGVSIKRGKFVAKINVDGKTHHLGVYPTAEQAHAAYLTALANISPVPRERAA